MSLCRSCGSRVVWARSESERRIPVDARPDPRGKLVLFTDAAGLLRAHHEANVALPLTADRFVCHLDSCPSTP